MEWLLKLNDQLSAPAATAEKKLRALEERMETLHKAESAFSDPAVQRRIAAKMGVLKLEQFELKAMAGSEKLAAAAALKAARDHHAAQASRILDTEKILKTSKVAKSAGLGQAIGEVASGLGLKAWMGWAALIVGAVEGFRKIVKLGKDMVLGFAEAGLHAAKLKENQIAVYTALLGSKEKAMDFSESIDRSAASMKFGAEEAQGYAKRLLASGIAADKVQTYLMALSDVSAAIGGGPEQTDKALRAIRQINSEGALTTRTMRLLSESGIPATAVYEVLAKDLKIKAEYAKELVKAGKINANEGLWAVIGAAAAKRSGGDLGSKGKIFAEETLAGLELHFADFKEQLFEDTFNTEGFGAFKGFWRNVNDSINPESAAGKRTRSMITDSFSHLFKTIFGPLSGESGMTIVEGTIKKIVTAIELAVTAGRSLMAVISGMATGYLTTLGVKAGDIFGPDGSLSKESMDRIVAGAERFGGAIGNATAKLQKLLDLLVGVGNTAKSVKVVSDAVQNTSPLGLGHLVGGVSQLGWLFDQFGGPAPKSEVNGRSASSAGAPAAWSPPTFGSSPASGHRSSSVTASTSVSQTMHFHGSADPAQVQSAALSGTQEALDTSLEDMSFAVSGGEAY
jgi:tape measure domain-containing protein